MPSSRPDRAPASASACPPTPTPAACSWPKRFEGAPALAAGIDRGTEILAIGTSAGNLRTVDSIIAAEGSAGITNALGPSTAGTTRVLQISDASGTRTVTVTKAEFDLTPVSSRYGARIIEDNGRRVGYVNLRTSSRARTRRCAMHSLRSARRGSPK
jgi:C-terminal processing protease CtpA/Prc